MSTRFALITFLDEGAGGAPTPPIHYPPYPSQPPFPTHPIAPGGPPPGVWPSPPQPPNIWPGLPGQGLPGQPPSIWPGPGAPDQGLPPGGVGVWPNPGHPSHPIAPGGGPSQGPGFPTHPIAPGGAGGSDYVLVWWPGVGWVALYPGARPDQGLPQPPTAEPKE
jgi:hypothetical protein